MSLENAILTHAAALEKLAEALQAAFGGSVAVKVQSDIIYPTEPDAKKTAIVTPDADLDKAVAKVEGDAKTEAENKQAAAEAKAAAKAKAEAKAKKEAEETQTKSLPPEVIEAAKAVDSSDEEDDGLDVVLDVVLDYKTHVRPALLAAIKRTSKEDVQALIKTFGVDKGEQIPADKLAEAKAKADKLGL